jgi:hypothetical protein
VLELEDPLGDDAEEIQAWRSIAELATYLKRDGNPSAASSLYQRLLLSLQNRLKERGVSSVNHHPATLATLEALSILKTEQGQLGDALTLLERLHSSFSQRLGPDHPRTVLCMSKMAAVRDLLGVEEDHEDEGLNEKGRLSQLKEYKACLDTATKALGTHHPAVFAIRENFARFLLDRDMRDQADAQLDILQAELKRFGPAAFSPGVARRITLWRKGPDVDWRDADELDRVSRSMRNTLGLGDFYVYDDSDDDERRN